METIIAKYSVCDCEHQGDIDYACYEIELLGGRIIDTEWNGEDCGEAYVYCEISKKLFEEKLVGKMSWYSAEHLRGYYKSKGLVN